MTVTVTSVESGSTDEIDITLNYVNPCRNPATYTTSAFGVSSLTLEVYETDSISVTAPSSSLACGTITCDLYEDSTDTIVASDGSAQFTLTTGATWSLDIADTFMVDWLKTENYYLVC